MDISILQMLMYIIQILNLYMIQQKKKCHNIILTVIIYGIILNIILHFVEMPFLAWIKHMNGFQKGFWRYDR